VHGMRAMATCNSCFSYHKDEQAQPGHLTNWCSFCPRKSLSHYSLALHFLLLFYFYISLSLPPSKCFIMKTFTIPRLSIKYWWPFLAGLRHVKLHTHRHRGRQRSRSGSVPSVGWPTYLKIFPPPTKFKCTDEKTRKLLLIHEKVH
jgi:hypothetical protein